MQMLFRSRLLPGVSQVRLGCHGPGGLACCQWDLFHVASRFSDSGSRFSSLFCVTDLLLVIIFGYKFSCVKGYVFEQVESTCSLVTVAVSDGFQVERIRWFVVTVVIVFLLSWLCFHLFFSISIFPHGDGHGQTYVR